MTVHYLTGEEVLAVGSAACKFEVTVGERPQFEANIARPGSSAFGKDAFPDLWTKGAALLHAFATTQTLVDGNKRTSWAAAWTFLIVNAAAPIFPASELDGVHAEKLVLQIAAGELSVEQIAIRLRDVAPLG
ncbi:type II toxin-antitoxin system death-on-curing family toxin [Gordonia sp. KTR9]|uniref:type II toxin-antitoxin system death-on-curing family toxin n=1 Tax=Gordonia sp. KTR9 TaxID=337191 RepID=UPI0006780F5F|nr:Fic family protein [Gordonia sp. KTR9]